MSHHFPIGIGIQLAQPQADFRSPSRFVEEEAIEGVAEAFRTHGRFDAAVLVEPQAEDPGEAGREATRIVRRIQGIPGVAATESIVGILDRACWKRKPGEVRGK